MGPETDLDDNSSIDATAGELGRSANHPERTKLPVIHPGYDRFYGGASLNIMIFMIVILSGNDVERRFFAGYRE